MQYFKRASVRDVQRLSSKLMRSDSLTSEENAKYDGVVRRCLFCHLELRDAVEAVETANEGLPLKQCRLPKERHRSTTEARCAHDDIRLRAL